MKSVKSKTLKKYKKHTEKTRKSTSTRATISRLVKDNKLREPNTLRLGHITQPINNVRYIVKPNINGKKYYAIANKEEIECDKRKKENISKFIAIYKSGKSSFKSINAAIKYAIDETDKEFKGRCLTTKIDKSIKKQRQERMSIKIEQKSKFQIFMNNIKQYTKNIYGNIYNLF